MQVYGTRAPQRNAVATPAAPYDPYLDPYGGGGGGRDGSGGAGGNSGGPSTPGDRNNDRAINSMADLGAAMKDIMGDPMNGVPGAIPGFTGMIGNIAGMAGANMGKGAPDPVADAENDIQAADFADRTGFATDQGDQSPNGANDGTGGGMGADPDGGAAYRTGGIIPSDGDGALEGVPATVHETEGVLRPEAMQMIGASNFRKLNAGKFDPRALAKVLKGGR